MKYKFYLLGCLTILTQWTLFAHPLVISTEWGEEFLFEIDPHESVCAIQEKIAQLSDKECGGFIVYSGGTSPFKNWAKECGHSQGGYLGYPRQFHMAVQAEERETIRFIVNSLANKSLISLALAKGDLEAAGDKIDHIHPLLFLTTVFTDEEMKVGVRIIRGRGWIWNHFIGGLKNSLSTEANLDNMKEEFIQIFARAVNIDYNIIIPTIKAQRWDDFFDLLIKYIPRLGDHDRYDTQFR